MASILKTDKIEGVTASGTVQMPAGHVVQVQRTYVANSSGIASASSSLVGSGTQVTITPKFSNSLILIDYTNTMVDAYNTNILARMYIKIGSASFGAMTSADLYHLGYNAGTHNRYAPFAFGGSYTATSTDTLIFEPYFLADNGTTVNFAHPKCSLSLTAMEIAQ